jgi:hypothetical protein
MSSLGEFQLFAKRVHAVFMRQDGPNLSPGTRHRQ